MDVSQAITLVAAISTSIISIIHAIGFYWGRKDLKKRVNRANLRLMKAEDSRFHVARRLEQHFSETKQKLNTVEENTNGNLTKAIDRIAALESTVTKALAAKDPEEKDKLIIEAVTENKTNPIVITKESK